MLRNTMKKGELAFSQIVIAVVAIFVLIVLMIIFGSNLGGVDNDLNSCMAKGGVCKGSINECDRVGGTNRGNFGNDCQVCCITVATAVDPRDPGECPGGPNC